MGSGTWALKSTGTVWNLSTSTNMTLDAQQSRILINNTTATTTIVTVTAGKWRWRKGIWAGQMQGCRCRGGNRHATGRTPTATVGATAAVTVAGADAAAADARRLAPHRATPGRRAGRGAR